MTCLKVLTILLLFHCLLHLQFSKKTKSGSNNKIVKNSIWGKRKEISTENDDNPLLVIAQFLLKFEKSSEVSKFSISEVYNALKHLASSQSALKSMDGATHAFRNTLSDSSSLGARFSKFINGKKKNLKEAGKISEYVTTVERSMQASEILQAIDVKNSNKTRSKYLTHANLTELKRFHVSHNKLSIVVSILKPNNSTSISHTKNKYNKEFQRKLDSTPQRYHSNEIIIAISDGESENNAAITQTLRVMSQKLETVPLKALGVIDKEVIIQPTLLTLANKVLLELKDFIVEFINPDDIEISAHQVDRNDNLKKKKSQVRKNSIKDIPNINQNNKKLEFENKNNSFSSSKVSSRGLSRMSIHGSVLPERVKIMGYSCGGAVASYLATLLDGSLNITSESGSRYVVHDTVQDCIGSYVDRVRCITLGSPPCISRTIVPRYVTSIICGDDIVPRAYPESIANLRKRTVKALKMGAGKGGLGWVIGAGWAKDLASVAGQSFNTYSARSRSQSRLSVPGRVFFVKARQHKDGASFQRVMRGNWREDMLWQLHDIMLSKRIIAHHDLDYYIQTLGRC